MKTIAELTGRPVRTNARARPRYRFVLPTTLMGVELEVDADGATATRFHNTTPASWLREHDGSLSAGYEYVLARPMAGRELSIAIQEMFTSDVAFHRTLTGSTHIHMDMLGEEVTMDVLRTLVLLVYTLEPMIYHAGDYTREWCGYANSLKQSDDLLLGSLFAEDSSDLFGNILRRGGALGRYYGLNLVALNDYGSVEFRYFPTATTADEMVRWVNLVQSFKKAAVEIGTPATLKNIIAEESSFLEMLGKYFGDFSEEQKALRGWRSVSNMFNKAMVEAQASKLSVAPSFLRDAELNNVVRRFVGLPEYNPTTMPEAGVVHANGSVPDDDEPQNGDVLIYGNNVYHRLVGRWRSVTDGYFIPLPRAVAALRQALDMSPPHLQGYILSAIQRGEDAMATGQYTVEEEEPEYTSESARYNEDEDLEDFD